MKKFTYAFWLLLSLAFSQATYGQQSSIIFNPNQVAMPISVGGILGWNQQSGQGPSNYSVPYNPALPDRHTFFASGLWYGAIDINSNLAVRASSYHAGFVNGPFPRYWWDSTRIANTSVNYNRIWQVEDAPILDHIMDFADNGQIDGPVDPAILAWPGRLNPHSPSQNGFAIDSLDLAPFFDQNADSIYNPLDGDYPLLDPTKPLAIPSAMAWWIENDYFVDSIVRGEPLFTEVHNMAYSFDCGAQTLLDSTIFIRRTIKNNLGLPFDSLFLGFWADPELGIDSDVLIGSAPTQNTMYWYDGDGQNIVYGSNPPVQAVTLLSRNVDKSLVYHNNGTIQGNPNLAMDHYNYLRGQWRDNSYLSDSDPTGYAPNGQRTDHMFPDPPSDPQGWSMQNVANTSNDDRLLMSTYEAHYPANKTVELTYALSFHWNQSLGSLAQVDNALTRIALLQQFYGDNYSSFDGCSTIANTETSTQLQALQIYPNPSTGLLNIQVPESIGTEVPQVKVFDLTGKLLLHESLSASQSINIGHLPKGMYIVSLHSGQQSWYSKVVKE